MPTWLRFNVRVITDNTVGDIDTGPKLLDFVHIQLNRLRIMTLPLDRKSTSQ